MYLPYDTLPASTKERERALRKQQCRTFHERCESLQPSRRYHPIDASMVGRQGDREDRADAK